jgi:hypothetical protein
MKGVIKKKGSKKNLNHWQDVEQRTQPRASSATAILIIHDKNLEYVLKTTHDTAKNKNILQYHD